MSRRESNSLSDTAPILQIGQSSKIICSPLTIPHKTYPHPTPNATLPISFTFKTIFIYLSLPSPTSLTLLRLILILRPASPSPIPPSLINPRILKEADYSCFIAIFYLALQHPPLSTSHCHTTPPPHFFLFTPPYFIMKKEWKWPSSFYL